MFSAFFVTLFVLANSLACFIRFTGRSADFSFFAAAGMMFDGATSDNRRDRYTAISAARASEGSRGMVVVKA